MALALKLALAAAVLVVACSAVSNDGGQLQQLRAQHEALLQDAQANPLPAFKLWVAKHAKKYAEDAVELESRFKIWAANVEYILEYNARTTSHWLALNSHADLTDAEFRGLLGYNHAARVASNSVRPPTKFRYAALDEDQLPPAIDWRKKSAVSEVKNQVGTSLGI